MLISTLKIRLKIHLFPHIDFDCFRETRHGETWKIGSQGSNQLNDEIRRKDEERRWKKMLIKQTHALPVAKKGSGVGVEEKFYGFVGDKLLRLLKHSVWWIFCIISKWLNLPGERR